MNKKQFLAMSLPYGLKGYVDGKGTISGQNIYILFSCPYMAATVEVMSTITGESGFYTDKSKFKPILHPLSDLTKTIKNNGETFVPIVELAKMRSSYLHESDFEKAHGKLKMDIVTKRLPFDMMKKKLTSWHFNLMDESEPFIDVNTLSENPYK